MSFFDDRTIEAFPKREGQKTQAQRVGDAMVLIVVAIVFHTFHISYPVGDLVLKSILIGDVLILLALPKFRFHPALDRMVIAALALAWLSLVKNLAAVFGFTLPISLHFEILVRFMFVLIMVRMCRIIEPLRSWLTAARIVFWFTVAELVVGLTAAAVSVYLVYWSGNTGVADSAVRALFEVIATILAVQIVTVAVTIFVALAIRRKLVCIPDDALQLVTASATTA